MIIDVIIPVYSPDKRLNTLLRRLMKQTCPARKIYIINSVDQEHSFPAMEYEKKFSEVQVHQIAREEFDHGRTRDEWMRKSDADIVVFLVQDALPADSRMIERLTAHFQNEKIAAVYGRHVTDRECCEIEKYTRHFNYPPVSRIKCREDIEKMGIKSCFCSNVCAAYSRSWYLKAGGFERHIIAAEDMVFAYRLLLLGGKIVYEEKARVYHYHTYGLQEQFSRNFDTGVLHSKYREIFEGLPAGREGIRLVRKTGQYLVRIGKPQLLWKLFIISAAKYAGYRLGRSYEKLPKSIINKCTRNEQYWKEEASNGGE